MFDKGTVNFAAVRNLVAGPEGAEFPPTSYTPGEVGDSNYSPFVSITNAQGVIYNAPMIAYGVDASQINFPNGNVDYTKVHDQVVAIDPINMTVTLNLINGFSFGRPVWYLSMDASNTLAATIEHNTYAPLMDMLLLGDDDSFGSPIDVSNNLSLAPDNVVNFVLGTNTTTLAVTGNLTLGGTNNIYAGPGFNTETYTLMTYNGTLSGNLPVLGAVPEGYVCQIYTNTAGAVTLQVNATISASRA